MLECQNYLERKGEVSDRGPVRYPKRTSYRAWALFTTLGAAVVPSRNSRRNLRNGIIGRHALANPRRKYLRQMSGRYG